MGRRRRVDHGERVEPCRVLAEGDEFSAERLGGVLERAPVVDHHRLAAGADDAGHQLLHQHRLAGAGFTRHGDVVVAGLVGEGRPAGGLAAPPDQEQRRRRVGPRRLSPPLAVDRRQVDRRRSEQRLHPAEAFEIGVETAGCRHRQAGEPGRQLDIAFGADAPALAVIDRAHRLLGLVDAIERRIDRGRVAGPDQPLAVLEALGDDAPVVRLLGQARQIAGDAGAGLLGGAGGFEERLLAVGGIAGADRERGQDRAARLQEIAVEIANQRVAAPARPDLGEGKRREHPDRHVGAVGIVEYQPGRRDRERASGDGALHVDRVARRPAPARAIAPAFT